MERERGVKNRPTVERERKGRVTVLASCQFSLPQESNCNGKKTKIKPFSNLMIVYFFFGLFLFYEY